MVELRDASDPASIVATDTVVVRNDTGVALSPARFRVPAGQYRVGIQHRFDLGVLTRDPVSVGPGITPTVDFTDPSLALFNQNPADAGSERSAGVVTRVRLNPGDVNHDNVVDSADYALIQTQAQAGGDGYRREDINLDGYVDGSDFGMINFTQTNPGAAFGRGSVPLGALSPTPSCDAAAITSAAPPSASAGIPYSFAVTASGSGPLTYGTTSGALPTGLSLDPRTGVLSGTPTAAGSFAFRITATNLYGSDSRDYTMVIPARASGGVASASPSVGAPVTAAAAGALTTDPTAATQRRSASRSGSLAVTGGPDAARGLALGGAGTGLILAGAATIILALRRRYARH